MSHEVEAIFRFAVDVAVPIAASVTLLTAAIRIARRRTTAHALKSRIRLAVLPTETFEPNEEEVLRYAHQLTRVHRAVLGFLTRPASAVRIRLESLSDGRVAYRIEGPARAASALRVGGYEDVELRPVADEPIPGPQDVLLPESASQGPRERGRGSEGSPPRPHREA